MKAADKAESLRADMKKLEETKIPTEDYKEISVQIEKAEQKFNRLLEKQEQMQREGKDNGTAWQRLNDQMDEIGNEIRYAKGELQDLVDTGKAFTLGSGTDAYVNMANQLKYTENNLSTLAQQHEVLETQQKNISTGYKKWGDIVKKSFSGVYNVLKKANDRVKSFGTWIKNIAQRHMPSLRKETERTSGTMSRFGKRLKSLLSGIFIFNVISSGFRSMFAAIKEGYENLYKGNKKFENSVDNLKASALTLKNALAAAFSPLVQIAIPYIQKVIEWMTKLADSVGQFIAAITGQKTYLRAVKQTTAAIKEQTKAENKQLSSLDKLNNLTSSKDSSGDDVGADGGFEEVPISDKWKNIADWLKDMLKNSDFYDLGRALGEKLKKALDSIPWNKIKKSLRKIAKSIATFLNGFLETPGLFRSIGKTIAEGINSAFEFVDEFVWDFHWKSLGQAIIDAVQGFVDTLDWDVIASAITGLAYGLVDLFNTIFGATETWGNVGMTIAKAINTVLQGLFLFVHNFDFAAFGTSIATLLSDALTNIAYWKLGNILANGINGAFTALYNFCETFDWVKLATKIADGINKALENLDWEQIQSAVESLATHLGEWIDTFVGEIDWEKVGSTIGHIIQLALDFVYTMKDSIDWTKVKDAITETLKSAINEIDMGELATLLLGLLAASITVKATTAAFKDAGAAIVKALAGALPEVISWTPHIAVAFSIGVVFGKIADALDEHFGNEGNGNDWGIGDYLDATVTVTVKQWFEGLKTNVAIWWSETWLSQKLWDLSQWWNEKIVPWFTKEKWSELWNNIKQSAVEKWTEIKQTITDKITETKENITNKVSEIKNNWNSSWDNLKGKVTSVMDSVKSKVKHVMEWIEEKIASFNTKISGMKEKVEGLFSGSGGKKTSRASAYAYTPAAAAVANLDIPGYATGQVIPKTMKKHLAYLGDNNQETEVVSPLSTIQQALREEMASSGFDGGGITVRVPVEIDGNVIMEIVKKLSREELKRTGKPAFT